MLLVCYLQGQTIFDMYCLINKHQRFIPCIAHRRTSWCWIWLSVSIVWFLVLLVNNYNQNFGFRPYFVFDCNTDDERVLLETREQHIEICNANTIRYKNKNNTNKQNSNQDEKTQKGCYSTTNSNTNGL